MKTLNAILSDLNQLADPGYISRMEHFGIRPGVSALGIKNSILKPYAKQFGRNQELANRLWNEPIHECKHLAIMLADSAFFDAEIAEKWTRDCYSWDLVDGIGMKVLPKVSFAYQKVEEWSSRHPEYEKRMAFATIVGLSLKGAKQSDQDLLPFLSILEREAWDNRNFVKKAISWALRQIGKRNISMNEQALKVAERISQQDHKAAKWIASDVKRELLSAKVQERLAS